jgi:hypothetical protein
MNRLLIISLTTLVRVCCLGQNSYPTYGPAVLNSGIDVSLALKDGRSGTNWNYIVWQFNDGGSDWVLGRHQTTGNFTLIRSNVGEVLAVDNAGNVGIGTSAPTAKLEINQVGGASGQNQGVKIWAGNSQNYFGNTQLSFSYGGGGGGYSHSIKTRHSSATVAGNAFDFYVWQPGDAVGGEGSRHVMSLNGGNVGIGTTLPQAVLHVSNGDLLLQNPTSGYPRLWLKDAGGTNTLKLDYNSLVGTGGNLIVRSSGATAILLNDVGGNVGIGTASPDQKLTVKGTIHTQEVKVDMSVPGPDYVFEKDYDLLSLTELENYINQNKHLPEVPSAKEMEKDGLNLKEMNLILLKKVEELTLHLIEQKKENNDQQKTIDNLATRITELEKK